MSFEPIRTDCRRSLGARFAYAIRKKNEAANGRLRLSICAELMRKANFGDGDRLRLDVDAAAGLGRLMAVLVTGEAVRRVVVRSASTGRGHYEIPWTGVVPVHFPETRTTELEVTEVKAGELTFELPAKVGSADRSVRGPLKEGGAS